MRRFKFFIITSYIFGLIFFLINSLSFEFFIIIDPILMILFLNIPSFVTGSFFYLFKKKLFWIFYGIVYFFLVIILSSWSIIEIYTAGDWGKIL